MKSVVRSTMFAVAGALAMLTAPHSVSAGLITYTLNNYPSLQNGWTVSGHITTSGAIGNTNITAWDYTFTDGSTTYTGSSTTGGFIQNALGVGATETGFSISQPQGELMLVADNSYSNLMLWSRNQNTYKGVAGGAKWDVNPSSLVSGGVWTIATAPAPVPEIDPAGIGSVLALVSGALALLERHRLKVA
jgi:hypothetical protein